jgi:hypothetical protein
MKAAGAENGAHVRAVEGAGERLSNAENVGGRVLTVGVSRYYAADVRTPEQNFGEAGFERTAFAKIDCVADDRNPMAAQIVEMVLEIRATAIIDHQNQTETSMTKMLRQIYKAHFRLPGREQHGNLGEFRWSSRGFAHQTHKKTLEEYIASEPRAMPHWIAQFVLRREIGCLLSIAMSRVTA